MQNDELDDLYIDNRWSIRNQEGEFKKDNQKLLDFLMAKISKQKAENIEVIGKNYILFFII